MRYFFLLAGFLFFPLSQSPSAAQEIAPSVPSPATPLTPPDTAPKPDGAHRRESRREAVELRLRALMNDFGLDDKVKQDALVAYLAEDEAGKASVRDAAKRLMIAARRGAEPERMRELISGYKAALEADKTRRVASQAGLDAKIGWSNDPRMEAALWLFGVLGEGQPGLSSNWLGGRGSFNARKDGGGQRPGVVEGVVANKGESWVEVRENGKGSERYEVPEAADLPAMQSAVKGAIAAVKIGDRVRLAWVGSERRRLVRLEVIPLGASPTENAPALQNKPKPKRSQKEDNR